MSKRKEVTVDGGKYATKGLLRTEDGKFRKIKFRTKMDETQEKKSSDNHSCVLAYKDDRVIIGESAETANYEKSKAKDIHKYSTYLAIAKLVEDNDNIILTIGAPLSIFKNVEERESYKAFMKGEGTIDLTINDEAKSFTIDKVVVCPEGSGIIFKNPAKYKRRVVGVIDIGGLNSNACIYDKMNPVMSTICTTNYGANTLRNNLKNELNSAFPDANIQDFQMEQIIEDGYIKSNMEESKEIIKNHLQTHINKIIDECKRVHWDMENLDIVFVGGGSLLLETEIKNVLPDAEISETADWDNAEGFSVIGSLNNE